jgi:hypothetical protein
MARKRSRVKKSPASDPLLNISDNELGNYIFGNLTTPPRVDKYVSGFAGNFQQKKDLYFSQCNHQTGQGKITATRTWKE